MKSTSLIGDKHGKVRRNSRSRIFLWVGVFSSFIYNPPRDIFSLRIGPLEIAKGVTPLLCIVVFLTIQKTRLSEVAVRKSIDPQSQSLRFPIVVKIFLTLLLTSTVWSFNPAASLFKAAQLGFVIVCLWLIVRDVGEFKEALNELTIVLHFVSVLGISMYLVIFQKSDSRLSFYFPQVSQNLIPMLLLIPLLSLLINKGPHVTRILPIRVSLISLYLLGVWESGSRISGLLSLTSISIFFLVYSFFVNEKKKTFNLFLIPFLFFSVFLAGILFSYSKAFQANWSEFFQRDQNVQGLQTLSGRTVVWQHSFEYIRENWLIGGGYYSGHRYALGSVSDLVRVHNNLDNTWLELQVNLGIFGVIAGFALIVHGLICSTWTRDYETITFLAFWTATFGVSFFNPTFQSVGITQVIFFYLLFCRDSIEVNRTFQDKSSQKIKTIPSLKRVN